MKFTFSLTVAEADLDDLDHVNNLVYLRWCLKAASAHSAAVGWPSSRYRQTGRGFVVREHHIKYRLPALLGDQVDVVTWIEDMDRVASRRRYHILRVADGRRLAEAETKWVFVDFRTMELTNIPEALREAFQLGDSSAE